MSALQRSLALVAAAALLLPAGAVRKQFALVDLESRVNASERQDLLVASGHPGGGGPGDGGCAEYEADMYQPPSADTCYIRVYRCDSYLGLKTPRNQNAGDIAWAVGKCGHYGNYLEVYQLEVQRDRLARKHHYEQCNGGHCPCPPHGKDCEGKPSKGFGWDRAYNAHRFSLPGQFEGDQWKLRKKEMTVDVHNCLFKYVTGKGVSKEQAITNFQAYVLGGNPPAECRSVHKHH